MTTRPEGAQATYTQAQLDAAVADAIRQCAAVCEHEVGQYELLRNETEYGKLREEVLTCGVEAATECRDAILALLLPETTHE